MYMESLQSRTLVVHQMQSAMAVAYLGRGAEADAGSPEMTGTPSSSASAPALGFASHRPTDDPAETWRVIAEGQEFSSGLAVGVRGHFSH